MLAHFHGPAPSDHACWSVWVWWVPFLSPRSLLAVSSASSPSSNEKKCPLPNSNFHKVRRYLGELSESCPRCGWPVSVLYRHEPPALTWTWLSSLRFQLPGTRDVPRLLPAHHADPY